MSYALRLESHAERQLRALPDSVLKRVDVRLRGLAANPRPSGTVKLKGREGEGWRIRVGDYRILYTIDDAARRVIVYRIGLRSRVYRGGQR